MNIAIIDYDLGNTASVGSALALLGYHFKISRQKEILEAADCLILPGVGAFNEAMAKLNEYGLIPILNQLVLEKKRPIIGICLGMQLLATDSYENGYTKGFNWIEGSVVKLNHSSGVKIPHVGWNDISFNPAPMFARLPVNPDFYFDHSYHFRAVDSSVVKATAQYGDSLVAVIKKEHIIGIQFHPEKSSRNGLKLLRGILEEVASC